MNNSPHNNRTKSSYNGSAGCYLQWSLVFMSITLGGFVLIEVGMTLAWGPLEKAHRLGETHEYAQDANIIVVSRTNNNSLKHTDSLRRRAIPSHSTPRYYSRRCSMNSNN